MIPSNRHPGTAARALSRALLMQTASGLLTARACRRPAARARPRLEGLEDRCGRRVFAQPRLDRRGGIRFTRLPRRHFALHAVFMAFLSSCPLADAGFIASSDAVAINASTQDRHMLQNTTNLAGTETSASISDPYFGSASAFSSVLPRQAGALLGTPYVEFRGSSMASVSAFPFSATRELSAEGKSLSSWTDVLHFMPHAVQAAKISAWGIYLDLSGRLAVHVNGGENNLARDSSLVVFSATWGGGSFALHHTQSGDGSQTFSHELSPVIKSQVDPFAPVGIQFFLLASNFLHICRQIR